MQRQQQPISFKRNARNSRPNASSKQNKSAKLQNSRPVALRPVHDSRNIRAPVAQTQIIRTPQPKFTRLPNGDIVIQHRELISDVIGSEGFQVTKIPINPGLQELTAWLSQIAPNYESYKFEKLDFEFKTTSPTTASGVVMCAVDYDASDPAPVDKQQLAAYKGYTRSSPWENFIQVSRASDLSKRTTFFVRNGALSSNEDIKLYDVGNLFLATQGQASDAPIGELYVSYNVRLSTPQLNNPALGMSKSSFFQKTKTAVQTSAGSNAPLVIDTGLLPATSTITATAPYQGLVSVGILYSSGGGAPGVGGTSSIGEIVNAISDTVVMYDAEVSFLAGQTMTIALGGTSANATKMWIRIGQYNNSLTVTPSTF